MSENLKCGYPVSTCRNCDYHYGRSKELTKCPNCGVDRASCQKDRPFHYVKDPDTDKWVNTGVRYDFCISHGNVKPTVGASKNQTSETVDMSNSKKTDLEIRDSFMENHSSKFQKTQTGFIPKIEKNSEIYNIWQDEYDNPQLHDLRGELALLRTYLQYNVSAHGDYPEAKDIRSSQKLIQQITTTITNLMELEAKLKIMVNVSEIRGMIEKVMGVILEADIAENKKIEMAESIKKLTSGELP